MRFLSKRAIQTTPPPPKFQTILKELVSERDNLKRKESFISNYTGDSKTETLYFYLEVKNNEWRMEGYYDYDPSYKPYSNKPVTKSSSDGDLKLIAMDLIDQVKQLRQIN